MSTFNLSKSGTPTFNLTKAIEEAGKAVPATLMFGAGWTTPEGEANLDVDLSIAALNAEGKFVAGPDASFAFFNAKTAISGVELSDDCRDGQTSEDGDDEFAVVVVADLPAGTAKLVASLSVHEDAANRGLSAASDCYIRVLDADTQEELVRVTMTDLNSDAADLISVEFKDGDMIAEAIERPVQGDLNDLVGAFL